ncbi:MAG: hypothetical protein JSW58_12840 [Candidatus Latescibacterota bacterium]|nr:MAG: hypothetical protein JSW58_12840 [Candidatus Latescibacterota bacterium]
MMRASVLLKIIGVVTLVALADCGKRPVVRPVSVLPSECEILQAPTERADTIIIALLDAIEPGRAPWAGNAGEQLLFGHLYETMINVDCLGEVRRGLAESWKSGEGGLHWTFELREGARFWDGTPVTASDVVLSWQDAVTLDTVIDSASVAGKRTVHVYLKQPSREVPRTLTASVFAVRKPSTTSQWPLGTGPYRITSSKRVSTPMVGHMFSAHAAFGAECPHIQFMETSADDPRDLLEGVIEMLVTADPAVVEYARRRPQFVTVALPWERTYVLLSTSRVVRLRNGTVPETIPSDLLDGLARDAVRGDARGYRPPSWWDDLDRCGELVTAHSGPTPVHASSGVLRIVYDSNDGVARDLAERIVALATTDPGASPDAAAVISAVCAPKGNTFEMVAEGTTTSELSRSLRSGDDFAYMVSVPRRPPDPCYEACELLKRAPWLAALGFELSEALIPLVDTRPYVIAKQDKFGLTTDWYGNVFVVNRTSAGR